MTGITLAELVERWPALVGPRYAGYVTLRAFVIGGTLEVDVISSPTLPPTPQIIADLRRLLPKSIGDIPLRQIRCRTAGARR